MRLMQPNIDEEGPIFMTTNEINRSRTCLGRPDLDAGNVESAILVKSVFGWQRRVRDMTICQMPLAKVTGDIACLLEKLGKQRQPGIQPVRHPRLLMVLHRGKMLVNTMPRRELSRHHRGSTGRTNGIVDGELLKIDPFLRHPVEVGCLTERAAMYAKIPVAPVIGENEDNVGTLGHSPNCLFGWLRYYLYRCRAAGEQSTCRAESQKMTSTDS